MNIAMGHNPQVVIHPRCPACGSDNTVAYKTQGITGGIDHKGTLCRADKQYRKCRECSEGFPVIQIKGEMANRRRRRGVHAQI